MDDIKTLYGYSTDEIDELAAELFAVIAEAQVPITLAVLSLCKAITMVGNDDDLDLACMMIDQLKEMADEGEPYELELHEDDEDSEI
jgi:hypothetical protein